MENDPSYTQSTASFLGDMYARWTLDCLVEAAHAISEDYFSSPEFYQGEDAPHEMIDLWLSYGYVRKFPNKDQRHTLAAAIFGASDGYSPMPTAATNDAFHQTRSPLFSACIAAQTATSAESLDGLNQQAIQELPNFQSYLGGFPGKAAHVAYEQIKAVSETAFAVLRSDTISSRFIGIHKRISEDWPLRASDANGDKLVAECLSKFKMTSDMLRDFPSLRAQAHAGKEALETIVQKEFNLNDLISKTYSWAMFTGLYEPYKGK